MKKFKFKSLTMRIWITFTAIILIIIFSISFFYIVAYRKISKNARIADLKVAHDILLNSTSFSEPNRFGELKNLKGSNHFVLNIDESKNSEIIDINGMNTMPPPQENTLPPHVGGKDDALKNWMTTFITDDKIYEKQFEATFNGMKFIFIISSRTVSGTGKSYLISYMPNMQDNSLLYYMIIIGVVFISIGFLTAKVVANYISKPLKELEEYTKRIARKEWKDPIEVKNKDEIGRLANSMNIMQKELKRMEDEEKMFLQSISHDLKTPVMVIMSHADAIIDGVYVDSVERTAEIIRDEAVTLEKKIKQMLYLNTLDYILGNNIKNDEINLQELLLNIINRFEVRNSKIEWNLDLDEIVINGNADKIQVAIENILDNELRYAEEKICLTLKKEGTFAVLEIYNDGPNIKEEHINHIFDNLYKDKTGNFGLGLAITKKIVDFYKGEIGVLNRKKGVSFIIKYPIS